MSRASRTTKHWARTGLVSWLRASRGHRRVDASRSAGSRRLLVEPLEDRRLLSIDLVSCKAGGEIGNHASWEPSISGDGRFVAFASDAGNLTGYVTDARHVLVKDMATGAVENRVDSDFTGRSWAPSLSDDGKVVAFTVGTKYDPDNPSQTPDSLVAVKNRDTNVTLTIPVQINGSIVDPENWTTTLSRIP